jgi:SNF2 family DNA or RNA helicase
LWNIVGILNPGAWVSYYEFGRRYGAPVETAYGVDFPGISNAEELRARLSEVMIRRLWKDVSDNLPAISRNIVVAEVDDKDRRKLDVVAASLRTERTNTVANLSIYRKQLQRIKLKTAIAEMQKLRENGDPVVLWTWHKEFAAALEEAVMACGISVWRIDGDVNPNKRDVAMAQWKDCKDGVFIATMSVAREGIDLSHSHLAIFAELDWTPAIIGQAEMRTFDPHRAMNITYIIADHVVDQRMARSLISKLGSSDPLGLGAAIDAIEAIRQAIHGPTEDPDLVRFVDDLFASGVE